MTRFLPHALARPSPTVLLVLIVPAITAATALAAGTDNWPGFRGARALAIADDDARLPETWSETENVAWMVPIEGLGWSSPVVWGDRVFVTTVTSDGEIAEPRMGLYFPYGSPQEAPPELGFPKAKEGDLLERSQDVHHWLVCCVGFETGNVLWKTEVHAGVPQSDRHLKNTYASETPVTDGERVYAYFGNLGVFALDMLGKVV